MATPRTAVPESHGVQSRRYTSVAILIHWLIALLLFFEIGLGLRMKAAIGPAKFAVFQQMLEREQSAKAAERNSAARSSTSMAPSARPAPAPVERSSSGMPGWVWGLGFAVVAFIIYRVVTARRAPPAMARCKSNRRR